jgi:hypothetical protein
VTICFYMDVHVPRAITLALRERGVDVLTSQEDGTNRLEDADLLDRATALERVLFTRDRDFLAEGTQRQQDSREFAGVVFAEQLDVSIGTCVHDLELIAKCCEPDELLNRIVYLPLSH